MTDRMRDIRFPPFHLDLRTQRLMRGPDAVNLRPKMWDLLRFLAQRPGELITKDELMEAVWGQVTVTISSLNQAVLELRRTLGDDARNPKFIETVHRRGFRFIARMAGPNEAGAMPHPVTRYALIGREPALRRLDELMDAAFSGKRQVAFITGDPGIGKSSLLKVFVDGLDRDRVHVLGGHCIELLHESEAYLPVLEAVDRFAHGERGQVLLSALQRYAPTWLTQLPWLLDEGVGESPFAGSPVRMLREFCVAIEALSKDRLTVLWLEDLHWGDPPTVDLVSALARRTETAHLLVLATYRPVDAAIRDHPIAPLKRDLLRLGVSDELALDLLNADAVERYVNLQFDGIEDARELSRILLRHTDGNPLFLETTSNHIVSRGWVREGDAGWEAATSLAEIDAGLPDGLRAIIESRLEGLSDDEIAVLEAASVVGETFSARAVAETLGIEVEEAEATCERFAHWGSILHSGDTTPCGDGTQSRDYHFLHQVFRKVLYARLSPVFRQGLHRRFAHGLEGARADLESGGAAEIAVHFERGGKPLRAIDYLERAADGVRRRFADREAVGYFEHALQLLESCPESEDRDRRELKLRLELARDLVHAMGYVGATQKTNTERALELGRRLGETKQQLVALGYRAAQNLVHGDLDPARDAMEECLSLSHDEEDPVVSNQFRGLLSLEAVLRGELERAIREAETCLSKVEGVDPKRLAEVYPLDYAIFPLLTRGWSAWLMGRPNEATGWIRAACERGTTAAPVPFGIAVVLNLSLVVEIFRRDRDAVEKLTAELVDCLEKFGLHWPFPHFAVAQSWLSYQRGEVDSGIERSREGIRVARDSGNGQMMSFLFATVAEGELARGRAVAGLGAIDEAMDFAESSGERFWEAEIHRLRGELIRFDGDDQAAEKSFRKSLGVSRRQGALSLELRGAMSLARLLTDTDRTAEGRTVLRRVYDRFEEGFDTLDLIEAKELLDRL
jgi:DNA-binding winged helix-turn-helix (wHTH) protein